MKFYPLVENRMLLPINTAHAGYCPQSIDTSITADLVRFHLYRQRTTIERLILGVLKVQQEKLDFDYLQGWIDRFGLEADWQRAKVQAGIVS